MRLKRARLVIALALLAVSAARAADRIDRVLAVVSGTVITESDVRAALVFGLVRPPRAGADPVRTALDQLIRRQLILGEVARSAAAEPDASQVARRMEAVRASFPSRAAYDARLAETAMNETRLRDIVEADIRIDDYMKQRFGAVAEPSDQEVADYYQAHLAQFTSGGRQLTIDEAKAAARERLVEDRRNQIVDDWVARLRRRAEVTDLYFADSRH
jgi:hypothetical protein